MNESEQIILRAWRSSDVSFLVRYANNRKIWINLRDIFPHPYTHADAEKWISICESNRGPTTNFAIELQGEAIGGIGCRLLDDVNCNTAEIGYWLGEPFWGRGIATAALRQTTEYAFQTIFISPHVADSIPFGEARASAQLRSAPPSVRLERLQASVFEWNLASARVLEKSGYLLEGRLRRSIFKDGRLADSLLYARIRQ